jgi:hypothetical protein
MDALVAYLQILGRLTEAAKPPVSAAAATSAGQPEKTP